MEEGEEGCKPLEHFTMAVLASDSEWLSLRFLSERLVAIERNDCKRFIFLRVAALGLRSMS